MKSQFIQTATELNISYRFRSEDGGAWLELQNEIEDLPVFYEYSMVGYQNLYFAGADGTQAFVDLSVILFNESKPVALWPLSAWKMNGELNLCSQESAIKKPVFRKGIATKVQKKIYQNCLDLLVGLKQSWGLPVLRFSERARGGGLDEWHRKLMDAGASLTATHDLYIDLGQDLDEIRRGLRKSYRSLINRGHENWKVELLENNSSAAFDDFMALHRHVAGRLTRSVETWNAQAKMLDDRKAFLVTLRGKDDNRLVGAGFFQFTRTESAYASAAYDRALQDHALGHVVQDVAVRYLKDRGVRWHYIGQRPYPGDPRTPTEKELAIGYFKEGFMTHLFLTLHTEVKG